MKKWRRRRNSLLLALWLLMCSPPRIGHHHLHPAASSLEMQCAFSATSCLSHAPAAAVVGGANNIFNFHLPQLCIRFGRWSTTWRILQQPTECSLKGVSKILEACAQLHSFEVTKDQEDTFTPPASGQCTHPLFEEIFAVDALGDFSEEVGADDFLVVKPEDSDPEWLATQQVQLPGNSSICKSTWCHVIQQGHQMPAHSIKCSALKSAEGTPWQHH